jgi:hypothetical protein
VTQAIQADGFDELAERMIAAARRRAPEILAAGMSEILDSAAAAWPVDSGASAGAFIERSVEGVDVYSTELVNRSGYAQFIHHGRTYDELVRSPVRELARDLPRRIARAIVEDSNG